MAEDQAARYDRIAEGYARYWAPVIRPAAMRLLDDLALTMPSGSPRLLDIGTGTGTLALGAMERWPGASVIGIDASSEMAHWAEGEADRGLQRTERARFTTRVAFADRLPFDDATFDGAMSSFVLQLVPSRSRALREARRVLKEGAIFGYVTWLRGKGEIDPPDRVFEEVLDEFGFDPPEPDNRSGDAASARAAAAELRRAGFGKVTSREDVLIHQWTAKGYLDFLEGFAEETLFADLVERERRDLRRRALERLGELSESEMRLRLPVVYVTGRATG